MLTALLESRPHAVHPPARRRGGLVLSVVAHAAVVALAVTAAGRAELVAPPARADTAVVYVGPQSPPPPAAGTPSRASGGAPSRASAPIAPLLPALRVPDASDALALPDVDVPAPGAPRDAFADGLRAGTGASDGPGIGADGGTAPDAPRDARTVERVAAPRPGTRPPRYPEALRAGGVEGSAVLRFVVDTMGRVEAGSVHVVRADHPLFAEAARAALAAARFRPAEVAGRPVRQLVEQAFAFTLSR
jgi:TonB family protein